MSQFKELPADLAKLILRGKEFKFWIIRGTALSEKVWSETAISSSRNGNGQVSAVHSHSTTKREIWVRMPDGKERNIALPDDTDFAVRDGHQLSIVCINSKHLSQTHFQYLAIANHHTDAFVFLQHQFLVDKLAGVGSWIQQSTANLVTLVTLGTGLIPIIWYSNVRYKNYVGPIEEHARKIASWSSNESE